MSQSGRVPVLHKCGVHCHPDPVLYHAGGHGQGSGEHDLGSVHLSRGQWHLLPLPNHDGLDAHEFCLTGHPQVSLGPSQVVVWGHLRTWTLCICAESLLSFGNKDSV